ncbi:hypothetical protein R5W24_006296, partial [Gemmata sp. JC717]|uniref:hypothetical protein n=1 Tax=Gemmata algarum TaxID=2975278 RepID=UPI0021BB91DB
KDFPHIVRKPCGLPTLSIRLSLARLLLDANDQRAAGAELLACAGEASEGDESERASWAELPAASKQAEPDVAPHPAT